MTYHLLVVDDDPLIHEAVRLLLPAHWKMQSTYSLSELNPDEFYHAAAVDMRLDPKSDKAWGLEAIKKLVSNNAKIEVIAMSGLLDMETMEKALLAGARRFLAKPLGKDEFLGILEKIESLLQLHFFNTHHSDQKWIGNSPASFQIKEQIARLRGEPGPILIEGETGTGKEVVAHLLNFQEGTRPFVPLNIAAVPENLFEAELFGYLKGSFTGADQNRVGLAEAAQGGDLFLDEIEALTLPLQVKLLRFLESGEIRKVGARESRKVNTRVITASNQNLKELVKAGKFREDLLYRLSSRKIELPPLRERADDIPDLARHFLFLEKPRRNKQLTDEALLYLKTQGWPGNVRELKRVLEQASLSSPLPLIRKEDLTRLTSTEFSQQNISYDLSQGLGPLISKIEADIIRKTLAESKDVDDAAKRLQISRSNLYKKIKDYEIEVKES
ncbi:MAG: sigma-54-dependent transcriptional regulator [Pseudobdellovibrionaceae bacterium]